MWNVRRGLFIPLRTGWVDCFLSADLPECLQGQQLVYGAEKKEKIEASCGVKASPPPVAYKWVMEQSSSFDFN